MSTIANIMPPKPPVGLNFNRLLLKLSKQMTTEHVAKLKSHFEGMAVIGEENMQDVNSPISLFNSLRDLELLSRDNIDILKDILFILNRKDLVKSAAVTCRADRHNVHEVEYDEEQSGFESVRFSFGDGHIDRSCIENLRLKVSNIALAPLSYVIVKVITFSPKAVTLSIPAMYVDILKDGIKDQQEKIDFVSIGVTSIELGETAVDLTDDTCKGKSDQFAHSEITALKEQLEEQFRNVKKRDDELFEAYKQTEEMEEKLKAFEETEKRLATLHENSGMSTTLWKITGKLDKNNNKPMNAPKKSQAEIQFQGLYQRITRIYPHISDSQHQINPKCQNKLFPNENNIGNSVTFTRQVDDPKLRPFTKGV